MDGSIEKGRDLVELSQFLSNINKCKKTHIGYCGENEKEIFKTLKEDFVSDGEINFWVARSNTGEIIAAIGLDIDGSSAEVWGPFNQLSSTKLQHLLWEQLVNENPTVKSFNFFINKQNIDQQTFMEELKSKKTGEHRILEINRNNFKRTNHLKSTLFVQRDFEAFNKLHNDTFPNTYYDAKEITKRLNNERVLRVLKSETNELQGYAYFEVDTEMAEATLEYIAITKDAQNQGIGTMLLREALSEMFSYPNIEEIKLSVINNNSQANHVYIKAGFIPKDILISYHLEP